jgi:large subunit ribosomal protein L17
MRHKRLGRKLGVKTKHRKSMFRNMVTDLFRFDRIKTTDMKAKDLRRIAEKIITLAKEGTLHKRRQAAAYIRDKSVLKKLFDEIAAKFKDRPGGYTRIIKLGFRKGDNTPISLIELVEEEYKPAKKKKAKASAKKPKSKETQSEGKPKAKSSKKESAEELGLTEEAKMAAEKAVPEPEPEPEVKAEVPVTETPAETAPEASEVETTPEAEPELKASETPEAEESAPQSDSETVDGKKNEE